VRTIGWVGFGVLAVLFAAIFAVAAYATANDENKDAPDVAARKEECRKVIRHLIEVSPVRGDKSVDDAAAKVPIEDIELCGAAYPESVACMAGATDLAAVKTCIPAAVECQGPATEVAGASPVFEVSGECKTVKIAANHARVIVKAAPAQIDVTGSDDHVELKTPEGQPAPKVNDTGARNKIEQK
jgi:hypothetical protein